MGLFENMPYTNFHELNADWIVTQVKKVMTDWTNYRENMDDWKAGVDDEITAFRTWFDNLDVQDEVRTVIDDLIDSGEFAIIINPEIATETGNWLATHITPTTPVIDNSLSVSGAAADSKTVGDILNMTVTSRSYLDNNTDIDTIQQAGVYVVGTASSAETMINWPCVSYGGNALAGELIVFQRGNYSYGKTQIAVCIDRSYIRYFVSGVWSNWREILTPEALNQAITENDPRPVPGGVIYTAFEETVKSRINIPSNVNINDYKQNGVYAVSTVAIATSLTNWPCRSYSGNVLGGVLLVIHRGSDSYGTAQIAICLDHMYYRYYTSNTWSDWRELLNLNSLSQEVTSDGSGAVTAGGIYNKINNNQRVTMGVSGMLATANNIEMPKMLRCYENVCTDSYVIENTNASLTQGICCDGKNIYYALTRTAQTTAIMRKRSLITGDLVQSAVLDIGHCEDLCFVPRWVPGFDNGNVDRIYCVDLNYSTAHQTGYYIHVLDAETLQLLTSFATDSLINSMFWTGIGEITYNIERDMFCVMSYPVYINDVKNVSFATFDGSGNRIKAIGLEMPSGTNVGIDSDKNYIYAGRYFGSGDNTIVYGYVLSWDLEPITRYQVETVDWEPEGMCHCEDDIIYTWNSKYTADRTVKIKRGKMTKQFYPVTQNPPYDWPTSDNLRRETIQVIE